jgi:lipopolysaccharide/colanic/teichoic acid biosynthesis glycosyltransferase/glycosyltransferase involved in cell wall biosynthesis
MRILILSQWFDPEPTLRDLSFARKLASHGHMVEVLTGFPNYPGGKLYPGYSVRPWKIEWMGDIRVCRVALYPSHDRSAVGRIFNYLSFAVASAFLGPILVHRPDVIYVYHPPGTIAFPALMLRRWFSAPIVYDVQDLWPDSIATTGMLSNRLGIKLLDGLCRFIYLHADRVVVLSPGFRKILINRGVSTSKIDVIYNWWNESAAEARRTPPVPIGAIGDFVVLFAGSLGLAQALDAVLEAASLCRSTVSQARFVFIGSGVDSDRLERKAREMQLDNVHFLPRQPMASIGSFLRAADVLLVHLKNDPLFRVTIPSKTQAYLAAGRPILMAVPGDAAELLERSGAGLVCESENPASIAEGVRLLFEAGPSGLLAMGRAGRDFYERELTLEAAVDKFDVVFRQAYDTFGHAKMTKRRRSVLMLKRGFDIVTAALLLLLFSPVLAVVALAIRLRLGAPVLFWQTRPGYLEEPFDICKFRSMRNAVDPLGNPLPDLERLDRFGAFLRRTSLDELPELWNVLRGEMSLVGPRPLLMEYLPRFTTEQHRRHLVRPGITGLAQISGRQDITFSRRIDLDNWYIDHYSLPLDLIVLLRTLVQVITGSGVRSGQDVSKVDDLSTPHKSSHAPTPHSSST